MCDVFRYFSSPDKNRLIMSMVGNMLKRKNLSKELWGEAISTTGYLLNRCPTLKIEKVTPEEAWLRFKYNLNHLRVFGSVAHRHVSGKLRKKLNDKAELMILVGYHSNGGYKLFGAENMRVVIN